MPLHTRGLPTSTSPAAALELSCGAPPMGKCGSRRTRSLTPSGLPPSATLPDLELTLEDFVRDSHLHALLLRYLSATDKKDFARLLFLVSVEEFKKLLRPRRPTMTTSPVLSDAVASPSSLGGDDNADDNEDAEEEEHRHRDRRRLYASKIIAKFMRQDSFLDIASENLQILNKSVWSFGGFLRNDLMMCAALSSRVDLFHDAEVAVQKALQPSFEAFKRTQEYRDLVTNARISYAFLAGDQGSPASDSDATVVESSTGSHPPTPSSSRGPHSYLTLERVLANRRLCSVFWVFLFKERTHQQLSLWMDLHYHLLPVLESFLTAARAEILETEDDGQEPTEPGELIDQILALSVRICDKFLAVDASALVSFVAESDQELLFDYERMVADRMDTGSFSLVDAQTMIQMIDKISSVIEYNLQVNDFVRFMGSESFKSLLASYQSRLLSPSAQAGDTPEDSLSISASSDCSMTTLQELFHCLNVQSHQPQRIRSKQFSLKELFQSQLSGHPQRSSLISSVLSFRLDISNKDSPTIVKKMLHTLAKTSDLRHHHALPDHVEAFFSPSGTQVIRAKSRPEPKLFHMTIGNAEKSFYGACLTRYVPVEDESQLGPLELVLRETEGLEVYIPVGLCIISRYPILDTLKRRLENVHLEMTKNDSYLNDANWQPSPEQMAEILSPFDFATVMNGTFTSLNDYVDFSMEELFNCLSIENVVALVSCMMMERQIVLVSSRYSVLTCVGETLKSLMAPLVWSHVFAPILPKSMLECLQCPTPYLFGVHSSYRSELTEMLSREGSCESIVVVDLDANSLSSQARPLMPEEIRIPLIANLQQILKPRVYFSDYVSMCHSASPRPRAFPERRVRACFRAAINQLLHPLEEFRYVLSDDFDYVVVFDRVEFLRRTQSDELPFYRSFLEAQVFSHQIALVA